MAKQAQPVLPLIGSIHIEPTRLEEYYGLAGTFTWKIPLSEEEAQRLQVALKLEFQASSESRQRRNEEHQSQGWRNILPYERRDYDEQGIVLKFLDAIRASAEWHAFYLRENKAGRTTYGPLDGSGERHGNIVTPEFDDTRIQALQGITFTAEGGAFSFETRDA